MQCPSCNSLSPDDVRFCLHCGYFLGEPETTQVRPPRTPPPSTIRAANFIPFSPAPTDYEPPRRRRRWPLVVAGLLLGIGLMSVGAFITALLYSNSGEVAVPPSNRQVVVLTTPTPIVIRSIPAFTPEPNQTQLARDAQPSPATRERPTPTPIEESKYEPTPIPSRQRVDQDYTIVNRSFVVPAGKFAWFKFLLTKPGAVSGRFQAYGGANDIAVAIMSADEFVNYSNGGYFRAYYHTDYITADNPTVSLPAGSYCLTFDDRKAAFIGKRVTAQFVVHY